MDVLKFIIQLAEKLTLGLLKVTIAALEMLARSLGVLLAQAWQQRKLARPQAQHRTRTPHLYRAPRRYRRRNRRRA